MSWRSCDSLQSSASVKRLQAIGKAGVIDIAELDHADVGGTAQELDGEGQERLAVGAAVCDLAFSFEDRRRQQAGEGAAHETSRFTGAADEGAGEW